MSALHPPLPSSSTSAPWQREEKAAPPLSQVQTVCDGVGRGAKGEGEEKTNRLLGSGGGVVVCTCGLARSRDWVGWLVQWSGCEMLNYRLTHLDQAGPPPPLASRPNSGLYVKAQKFLVKWKCQTGLRFWARKFLKLFLLA